MGSLESMSSEFRQLQSNSCPCHRFQLWLLLIPFFQKIETQGTETETKNLKIDTNTKAVEQKAETPSEILPVVSNVTSKPLHYDIERIQKQRHKQFQYVCEKYKDEIPPNVSHNI